MPYKKDAERAIEGLNGQNIEGRILKVSIAKDNQKVKTVKVKSQEFHLDEEPRKTIKIPMKRKKEKGLKVLLKYLNKS